MRKSFLHNVFSLSSDVRKNRVLLLDYIRGIIMLLVLYHHAGSPMHETVLQFHMAALFLLSGYTEFCLQKNTSFCAQLKTRFIRLIVPYFFFELLNLLMFVALQLLMGRQIGSPVEILKSIITATNTSYLGLYGRLWFLPTMFFASMFTFAIRMLIPKEHNYLFFACALVMFALSFGTSKLSFRLPFTVDIAFLATAFILLGYGAGSFLDWLLKEKHVCYDILIFLLSAAILVGCNLISNPKCFMYINQYEAYPLMVAVALAGSFIVFLVTKWLAALIGKLKLVQNLVIWYSLNSLTVFPIHLTIKVLFIYMLKIDMWFVVLAAMLLGTIPIVNFIRSYMPFMIADFKKQKV